MATLPVVVFDVNETLLDLDALTPHFERLFGRSGVLQEWFAQLILYSQTITLTGDYVPFGDLGGAVLRIIGAADERDPNDQGSYRNFASSRRSACCAG